MESIAQILIFISLLGLVGWIDYKRHSSKKK